MVPPGTALSAAALSVVRSVPVTSFSSLRTGWAPPGPRAPAGPPAGSPAVAEDPEASGVVVVPVPVAAVALSVPASTPPPTAPATSKAAARARVDLKTVELFIVCLLVRAVTVTATDNEVRAAPWMEAGPSLGGGWQSADGRLRHRELLEVLPNLAAWVVLDAGVRIEHHRRPCAGVVRRPRRQRTVVGVTGARELHPCRGEPIGHEPTLLLSGEERVAHGVERRSDVDAVDRAELAVVRRGGPVPLVDPHRRAALRGLALRLQVDVAPEARVGQDLGEDQVRSLVRLVPAIQRIDLVALVAEALAQRSLQRGLVDAVLTQRKRGVLQRRRHDQRHVGRLHRRLRVEGMTRQRVGAEHRREGHGAYPQLRLQQLLPWQRLDVADVGRSELELAQQLLCDSRAVLLRLRTHHRTALHRGAGEQTPGRWHRKHCGRLGP